MQQSIKSEDVLIMNLDGDSSYAFFVNESKYKGSINNITDLLQYLEIKYLQRTFLEPHNKFFYMEFYKEYGPYTADQLLHKMQRRKLNPLCLIRSTKEADYSNGMRVRDLQKIKNL
ncbi:hypothetical protein ML462_15760 [Gramella lutea]|uniref:Uncharacterized protein n=1 Tax=Christiangramia lutea TaxID=1607951 RepID=A0A9X1V697_9FLAO|nr:hypothetical protein [Christiangramia lutea]MCH4824630.1 hypothetical protein [Christiangramia lutea]